MDNIGTIDIKSIKNFAFGLLLIFPQKIAKPEPAIGAAEKITNLMPYHVSNLFQMISTYILINKRSIINNKFFFIEYFENKQKYKPIRIKGAVNTMPQSTPKK